MSFSTPNNPFALLGLDPKFAIKADTIEHAYLTRLASAHPDAGGGGSSGEIDSAALNHARATLLNHEKRGIALLTILGGPDASACKDLPDGFLMEMMTRRQEIEEQIATGKESRANWEDWARGERSDYTERAGALFEQLGDKPSAEQLIEIRVLLNAWRYIERLIEQLDPEYDPASTDFR